MVTFLATLLVNILVGTIFYLVISLKIEKSASELYVRKIRKEMDDIIREFNMTADQNISLLENRIEILKRLLEKSGIPSGFEVSAGTEDDMIKEIAADDSAVTGRKPVKRSRKKAVLSAADDAVSGTGDAAGIVKTERELKAMFAGIKNRNESYALASDLYRQGVPVETIARVSGMPSGEVSLVISLL